MYPGLLDSKAQHAKGARDGIIKQLSSDGFFNYFMEPRVSKQRNSGNNPEARHI